MISRIPTRRPALHRALSAAGEAVDKHPWLPLAVVLVALYFINS